MMLLVARAVGTDDSECFTLGFAEEPDGDGPALLFQRTEEGYSILTDTQTIAEGGIEAWQLAEGWLKLTLSADAASTLGVDREILIQFAPIHTDMVRAALARILGTA